ncbi:MAG TPA: hypothetical protein VFH72_12190 [Candidatus Baltobacteraceae bacterium]|nr:hypothetical protein [Candidatus Baltobacteraceae bacterium]
MRTLLSFAIAAAVLLAPTAVPAATTVRTVNYHTTYRQSHPIESAGSYAGRMTLHFYADGTVNGTYRDEFAGGFRSVSGGLNGSKLWLSFGGRRNHQFTGTIGRGGVITGSLTNWRGPNVYTFKAVPSAS